VQVRVSSGIHHAGRDRHRHGDCRLEVADHRLGRVQSGFGGAIRNQTVGDGEGDEVHPVEQDRLGAERDAGSIVRRTSWALSG
jgi:hypothetical protein